MTTLNSTTGNPSGPSFAIPLVATMHSDVQAALNWCNLADLGVKQAQQIYCNLSVPQLVEHAIQRGEGQLTDTGALCIETGKYTGRSPQDRFIVDEPSSRALVDWNQHNVRISQAAFDRLYQKALDYMANRELYVFEGFVGADPHYRFGVRVINELASQNLFAHQLFRRPTSTELNDYRADFTVIAIPGLQGHPATDHVRSEAFVILHLSKGIVLVGGTFYAGEIKKSIFSLLNYHMVQRGVLPMHSAANVDDEGNTALFFGLSGTGKTSLSVDNTRHLIGDDEHGWSTEGVFNFEGGCYAKTIRLSHEHEPQIWDAIRFGALLENVILDPHTRVPCYDDDRLTENTRVAYPLEHIANCDHSGVGGHPKTILFLAADAFGVLPPIAKLTPEQAMYHFLSGYTSKLAGTERGITSPQATFSACFGQCFFPMSPTVYAHLLGERLHQHPDTHVYLVNTGWIGGPYGVGQRIAIEYTRAMVEAALNGELERASYTPHPIFKVGMPTTVSGVPSELLNPKQLWQDAAAYDRQAQQLAQQFAENFRQFTDVRAEVLGAGPG